MAKDVNGIVYLVGKEKAIINGFFGKTINPEIVFLFVNKNGMKYYINNDILKGVNKNSSIKPGKFYELTRIDRGRRFLYKESSKKFDKEIINKVIEEPELKENIEFNTMIMNRELDIQLSIGKRKNTILDIMGILIAIIVFSLTKKFAYSIPFIIILFLVILYMFLYNKKMLKKIEKI